MAHKILSLQIQIEEAKKEILQLKEKLNEANEKISKKDADYEIMLNKTNTEAENLIQRHQKFIKKVSIENR